ncbi:MAG TPA: hypothetical protein PLK76_04445 [bacterium]|nr:hypothetical protein [bacterium]
MKTPAQFYKQIGVDTLMTRKVLAYTKKELLYLKKYLNKKTIDFGFGVWLWQIY